MAIFGPKHGLTPVEKCQFLDFLNFCFYSLEKRIFVVEYRRAHFPGFDCLKKKVGIMAIFGPNHWLNPLEKFEFFEFLNFLFLHFPGLRKTS